MNKRHVLIGLFVGILVAALVFGIVRLPVVADNKHQNRNIPNNPTTTDVNINLLAAGKGCDTALVATKAVLDKGFQPGEFVVGQDKLKADEAKLIDWSAAEANERGSTAFSDKTPTSATALVEGLKSEDDKAKAALKSLQQQSQAPAAAIVDPSNWVPVQFTVDTKWPGNTSYKNGKSVPAGTRKSAAGDIVWLFVNPDICIAVQTGQVPAEKAVTAHRAGCGNPQTALPVPAKPSVPTTPTGSQPGCPNGVCPKDPTKNVLRNPLVPAQPKGPGKTPVGTSPGAATPTHETPTGCDGTCPGGGTTTTTRSSTTTTTPPSTTPVSSEPPSTGNPGPPPSS